MESFGENPLQSADLRIALTHDIQGMMTGGIIFQRINTEKESQHLIEILKNHRAVFITDPIAKGVLERKDGQFNPNVNENTQKHDDWIFAPGVFTCEDFLSNGTNVVKAVANGRRKAVEISQYLASQV